MNNKQPQISYGKCSECQIAAEYYFNDYGAIEPCINCDAAPIQIIKVILVNS